MLLTGGEFQQSMNASIGPSDSLAAHMITQRLQLIIPMSNRPTLVNQLGQVAASDVAVRSQGAHRAQRRARGA